MAKGASKPAKKRSGGLLIHVAILLILMAIGWQLYSLRSQVAGAQAEKDRTAQQVETLKQSNDALRADIAEGATDEKMKDLPVTSWAGPTRTNTFFTTSPTDPL